MAVKVTIRFPERPLHSVMALAFMDLICLFCKKADSPDRRYMMEINDKS